MAGSKGGNWAAVFGRFLMALLLVYGTFNPLGRSWFHWAVLPAVQDPGSVLHIGPLKVLVGLILLIGWVFFIQATRRSLGTVGVVLGLAVCGVLIWLLISWHVLSPGSTSAIVHLVLISVSIILALGSGWSILTRKVTGQVDTDVVQ
jgi:hypothetical protein